MEMFRRQPGDETTRRKLQRLDKRLRTVAGELDRLLAGLNATQTVFPATKFTMVFKTGSV